MTNENIAKTKKYIQQAMSGLADDLESGLKQKEADLAAYLEVCSTGNTCRLGLTHINGDPDDVLTLTIGVHKNGTDRVYSQFDFVGTIEEFIEYVRKPIYDYDNFYERIMVLSDKADAYYD